MKRIVLLGTILIIMMESWAAWALMTDAKLFAPNVHQDTGLSAFPTTIGNGPYWELGHMPKSKVHQV